MQNYEELSFEALQELRNNLEAQAIKLYYQETEYRNKINKLKRILDPRTAVRARWLNETLEKVKDIKNPHEIL